MKYFTFLRYLAIAGLILLIPFSSPAVNHQKESKSAENRSLKESDSKKQKKKAVSPEFKSKKRKVKSAGMPIYKPPKRGAPAGRVGGGTRGAGDVFPKICVLAPDHAGLTIKEQPCFYWYMSKLTTYPIEFTLIEAQAINPLLEKRIAVPKQPGIQQIRMADLGDVHLRKGFRYKWFIALVLDPDHRSKDIISGAEIEMVELNEALQSELENSSKAIHPHIYADEGLWYDALEAISVLINAAPNDLLLREKRASLLEQVGLKDIAVKEVR